MSDPTPDPVPAVPPSADTPADDPMDKPLGAGIDFTDPNSPLAPLYASVTGVLAVLLVGAAFALYSLMPMMHTDVWGHLAYGRWIVEHRQFPEHDPLSPFTDRSAVMYHQCWLSQVLAHGAFTWGESLGGADPARRFAGGAEAVRQLHVFAATATLVALWVAFRRASGSGAIALVGVAAVVAGGVVSLGLFRPQVFGLLLFAVFLAMLSRPVLSKAAVVAIPLLLALWANLHGSFAVGFALLGLAWAGRVAEAAVVGQGGRVKAVLADAGVRRLTLAIVLGLAAACLNPAGPRIYLNVLAFGSHPNLTSMIEWQPLTAGVNLPSLLVFVALWVGVLACQLLARRRVRPVHYLAVALFGLAPLLQQRLNSWWLLVGAWVVTALMGAVAVRMNWSLPRSVPSFRKTVMAVAAAVPFLLLSPLTGWVAGNGPPAVQRVCVAATPVELAAALADPAGTHGDRVKPVADALKAGYAGRPLGPVFCSPEVGEFLFWRDISGAPPVRFAHPHLFAAEHWARCQAVVGGQGWAEWLDELRVNVIAVEPDFHAPLVAAVGKSGEWRVVLHEKGGRDPRARLFVAVRKVPK